MTDSSDRAENAGSLPERKQRFDGIVDKVVERWNSGLNNVPGNLDLSGFLKLLGADRVGDYISTKPRATVANIGRRGAIPQQYETTLLDEEGLTLKAQLKQLHRWSWPLREIASLIDTQQRSGHNKGGSPEDWKVYYAVRWEEHIHLFLPGFFRVLASLQGFCNPANAGGMPFGLNNIAEKLDMGGWDEAAGIPSERDDSAPKTIQSLVYRLQKNVRSARDYSYVLKFLCS